MTDWVESGRRLLEEDVLGLSGLGFVHERVRGVLDEDDAGVGIALECLAAIADGLLVSEIGIGLREVLVLRAHDVEDGHVVGNPRLVLDDVVVVFARP